MSAKRSNDRVLRLLATARTNPEFAARVAQELPPEAWEQVAEELAKPEPTQPKATKRPGLRKCKPRPSAEAAGLSAQLNLFAKSVSRVS